MADDNHRVRVFYKEVFQPDRTFEVEIVGWFVK